MLASRLVATPVALAVRLNGVIRDAMHALAHAKTGLV